MQQPPCLLLTIAMQVAIYEAPTPQRVDRLREEDQLKKGGRLSDVA